jgi:hypothetical protein
MKILWLSGPKDFSLDQINMETMKLLKRIVFAGLLLLAVGCNNNNTGSGLTTVKVLEVEQVANYTYLLVKAKGPEYWIAVPTMVANPGESYQYQGGMMMEDFESKELGRTFDKVLFLEALYSESAGAHQEVQEVTPGSQVNAEKSDAKVEAVEGTVSIGELFSNPGSYEGKAIKVRGEVTKFNAAIMDRNWVHLQDGTESDGKFDLTATSTESFMVGSVVTVEGVVILNQDFGYGYSYEILLENTTQVK